MTESCVRASTRKDYRDKYDLDEITTINTNDPDLDEVAEDYMRLDRALLPALEKVIKGHKEIESSLDEWITQGVLMECMPLIEF